MTASRSCFWESFNHGVNDSVSILFLGVFQLYTFDFWASSIIFNRFHLFGTFTTPPIVTEQVVEVLEEVHGELFLLRLGPLYRPSPSNGYEERQPKELVDDRKFHLISCRSESSYNT